jgi:HlyD family secretion protein
MAKYVDKYGCILFILMILSSCTEKLPPGFIGSGTLDTTEVLVSPEIPGKIIQLTKEEGDEVKKDELLAVLDTEKMELQRPQLRAAIEEVKANVTLNNASIQQAKDNLNNLEVNYNRIKELYNKKTATKEQLDDITTKKLIAENQLKAVNAQTSVLKAKQDQIEASLNLLERQLKDGKIYSSIDGLIIEKYVELGEIATPGGLIYKIGDLNSFWVKIYLAETDLGIVKIGDEVKVEVDAYPEALKGIVTWVSSEAEFTPKSVQTKKSRAELVYAVKVTIFNPPRPLKIGMPVEVFLKDSV